MCLVLLAHGVHPGYPLVFAANRDEFHERPTARAAFWHDAPEVLAGRDLRAGGTWMGVTRTGRWAAVTNHRDPAPVLQGGRSRGELVGDFLRGDAPPAEYIRGVEIRAAAYNGFNLLVGEGAEVHYFGNRGGAARRLPPGVYGLSNDLLDTPWPKVERGKRELRAVLENGTAPSPAPLLDLLFDTDIAPDHALPSTGVRLELERVLSASFIVSPLYGTRSSTVLLIDAAGVATFVERSFLPGPVRDGEDVRLEFELAS